MFGLFNKKKEPVFNDQLADFVEKEYQKRQVERKPFELQWRLNLEFIAGNQYLDINPVSNTIEEIPKMFWYQEREVFNQVATIYETRVARLSRQRPIMKTRPASSDDNDLSASKVSSMLLQSSWHDQNMGGKYQNFNSWLEGCGTVFWKPIWSSKRGRVVFKDVMPKQETKDLKQEDEPFGAAEEIVEIREGDIETCIVPAFELFPDSSYRNTLEDCRSIIHARAYHIDEIEDLWGMRVDEEQVDVMSLQTVSGNGGLGYSAGSNRFTVQKLKGHAVLKEYYERPSKKYPKGRFIVVASKKCLHAGPLPYLIGDDGEPEFPFIRTVSIDNPGIFWGGTVVQRCIPIQRRYNALRNRKAEYLNLVTIGQWYDPDGSLDDDQELNNAPGNIIRYRPGAGGQRPEPVVFPSLPASFENEIQTLLAEFTAVSGVSELSRMSEAPSGVKSGVALSIANEQDDTRLAATAHNIADGTILLGKYWIRLYRQFVQEPRVLRTVGSNREVEVREWTTSHLKSDDVIIENASALAETPSQRRQMVFDLAGIGAFDRPETNRYSPEGLQKLFELLEFGHWETGFTSNLIQQTSRARRENKRMMEGYMAQVEFYDDHELHIQQHTQMMMQTEYEQLIQTPAIGPIIDQLVRMHIMEHMQSIYVPPEQPEEPPQK